MEGAESREMEEKEERKERDRRVIAVKYFCPKKKESVSPLQIACW